MKTPFQTAHVTCWLSARGGGIPVAVLGLLRGLLQAGVQCLVAGLADGPIEPNPLGPEAKTILARTAGPSAFGFSTELEGRLGAAMQARAVVHSHGLWMHPGIIARRVANSRSSPMVVSPHGMLEPWALENSRLKKRVAAWLFENRNLRAAACLHALCEAEARNLRHYGLRNPIAVIPNGVELPDLHQPPAREEAEIDLPGFAGKKRLLFLSRIHPKKGLPHLLRAWKQVQGPERGNPRSKEWVLAIAGSDQGGHEADMKRLAGELDLRDTVVFLGPLYGEAKNRALAGADAFVLPSLSEGFSMAILEAAAWGLPVVLTPECNFPELAAAGAAVEVRPDAGSCETGLRQMLAFSVPERRAMGRRGRELIERNYTWPMVASQMIGVYSWLLGEGPMPGCVRSN